MVFSKVEIAKKVYESYLKKYTGNLLEKQIMINITKLLNPNKYKIINDNIHRHLKETLNEIDEIVIKMYGVDKFKELFN